MLLAVMMLGFATSALAERVEYDFVLYRNYKYIGYIGQKGDDEQNFYVTQSTSISIKTYYGVRRTNDDYTNIANTITVAANTSNVRHRNSYKVTVYEGTSYNLAVQIESSPTASELEYYFCRGAWNP